MKKQIFLALLVFVTFAGKAQQNALKISVVNEAGVPLDYFNVLISNPADSSYITGEVFYLGDLNYKNSLTGRKTVKITSLGYKEHSLDIDFDNPIYPAKIVMQRALLEIGEVMVQGRRAPVKFDKGKMILQISGSSLAHLSDITTIMSSAPGVKATDNELTVLGRGEPLIYIDGKQATYTDLKILLPTDILSIEIDRNPSAHYDASAKAVMKIKTKKATKGISGRINAGVDIAQKTSPTAGGQLQANISKLYTFVGLDFSTPWYKTTSEHNQTIVLPQYVMTDNSLTKTLDKYTLTNFLYNSVLKTSSRSKLSWQYRLNYTKIKSDRSVTEKIEGFENSLENILSTKKGRDIRPSHKFNVGYQVDFDSIRKLDIFGDYEFQNRRSNQVIVQENVDTYDITNIHISNQNKSNVASLRTEYTTQLAKSNLLLGASYGFIKSHTNTDYDNELFNTKLTNNTLALYSTFGREYKKWGYEIGLRYEYLNDKLLLTGGKPINRIENKVFPSAQIHTNELCENFDMALNYANRTFRPSLGSLDPTKSYINAVTVAQGNPNLLSAVYHNIALNFMMWKNLTLSFEYNIALDSNLETGVLSEDKKMVIFTPVNLTHTTDFNVMLSYAKEWKWFSLSTSAMLFLPNCRIPYLEDYYDNNIVSYEFKITPRFRISKNTNISLDYEYTSQMSQMMTIYQPGQNLSLNFSQYLFNRRMQVVAGASNLLKKYNSPWHDKIGYYECYDNTNQDTRRLRISVRYLFNKFQSKYKGYRESEQSQRIN